MPHEDAVLLRAAAHVVAERVGRALRREDEEGAVLGREGVVAAQLEQEGLRRNIPNLRRGEVSRSERPRRRNSSYGPSTGARRKKTVRKRIVGKQADRYNTYCRLERYSSYRYSILRIFFLLIHEKIRPGAGRTQGLIQLCAPCCSQNPPK